MKKINLTIKIILFLLVIALISVAYIFSFSLKKSNKLFADIMDFPYSYEEAEGFIDANFLTNENKLIASNNNYELYLDETTSHFYLKDLISGEEIHSNPDIDDPRDPGPAVTNRQNGTIEYRYLNKNGSQSAINQNYTNSIYHPETLHSEEGYRTYKIKEIEDGFQVFYRIKDLEIDYLYFPLYLEPDVFEPILADRDHPARKDLVNAYWDIIDNETGAYKARSYKSMSGIVRKRLYKIFYEDKLFGEYSRERAMEENARHGYKEEEIKFSFDIALQIKLHKEGIEIKVINNSIKEYSDSKLAEISLYPYFGTALDIDPLTNIENEGYLVIPDGSGAVLNFNNGKTSAVPYSKRLYGEDMSLLPYEMPEEQEKILIPLYGMVKEKIGFAAIITEGDALATINANVSGGVSNDSYNKIYPNFKLREYENAVLGSGWNTYKVNLWTKDLIKVDFTINYYLLSGDDNNYVGVAKAYQNYLIKEKGFIKREDISDKIILELLGAYEKRKFFLGIPYDSMGSLTNYNQALKIVSELNELGINNLDIIYKGITNGGLENDLENKVKFERKVGSKREFIKFKNKLALENINVYPTTNFFSTNNFRKPFAVNRYTTNRIRGDMAAVFNYNIPTRLPNSEITLTNIIEPKVISPLYYQSLYQKYNKNYSFDNLMIMGIGSNLAGSYKKRKVIYLNESQLYQENVLKEMVQNQNLAVSEPLGFSYSYLTLATDLPLESTLYTVLDYQIPLVQLVLSGIVNYTHKSINLASSRDIDYQFLKALENGANLKYTLSYEDSIVLLETNYNEYMSTRYTNWLSTIKSQYDVIKNNNLDKAHLVDHKMIASKVFESTYNNGVVIITNYNLTKVIVDGNEIEAIDFFIIGGGS